MNIADLFTACNRAGVRVLAVDGQIELRGQNGAIPAEVLAGAAEHKTVLLGLLASTEEIEIPDGPPPSAEERAEAEAALQAEEDARRERLGIVAEANVSKAETAAACEAFGRIVGEDGYRSDHDWRDWRLEWLLHVGQLHLRIRGCRDAEVLAMLQALAGLTPTSKADWLKIGRQILDAEHELRHQGRLPDYPWPDRGEV